MNSCTLRSDSLMVVNSSARCAMCPVAASAPPEPRATRRCKNNCKDYRRADFETFLKEADIISVHAPLTDATRGLIDENAFDKMKPTAYFINVGRGPIVKEEALKIALDEDKIAGAGIDVFDVEPLAATSPLMNIKNKDKIVMTPHIAWASVEARKRLIDMMIDNFSRFRGL